MMTSSGFRFDAYQQYQIDAISAVVGLFDGQPRDAERLATVLGRGVPGSKADGPLELSGVTDVGAVGNNLVLDESLILENLQSVQDKGGLEVSPALHVDGLDFDIEMETGTGKTYVYLRTIFELARNCNFTKFLILVPSVAIREGVTTSIRLMRDHFRDLYPAHPFDFSVYSGKNAEEVQGFATATSIQIMVMTIDSIRGDANTRVMHQTRDKLNGLRPIDYLRATRPVVIMDEPQNMESKLSQSAIGELDPAFTLRYSATHKTQRNVVYRLDPVDAHDMGLVKQIVVAEVQQQGADASPYIKLVSVKGSPDWKARFELSVRKADGSLERREVSVKKDVELSDSRVTDNAAYDGWRVLNLEIANGGSPASVELTLHGMLAEGETIGGASGVIYKEMIRETIREHFKKEQQLRSKGIKVLSLFFVDKVASFLGDGTTNDNANGDFVRWFDEAFVEERAKVRDGGELLPQDPSELRRAYFSQIKRGGATSFQDSSGATKADDDAYELIMKDKERLLDPDEPVRFIFSHSALREGWDNPNVFQICTLREMGAEVERRQTIGRGLRLPVAKTDKGYERIADNGIATLTVIANESYQAFAKSLQNEYKAAGIAIGQVRITEFAKIPRLDEQGIATEELFGSAWSRDVYDHLVEYGYVDDGQVTAHFQPDTEGFTLHLPERFQPYEAKIIDLMRDAKIEKYVKPKSKRQSRKLNKELYASPMFEEFWYAISQKTTYRVSLDRDRFIADAVAVIQGKPKIEPLRIEVTKVGLKVMRGGAKGNPTSSPRATELQGGYDLPDIITELQEATSLTRRTIVDILVACGRLDEFIANPNDFIAMVKNVLKGELAKTVVEGIQYEKIGGSIYELRELQKDGLEEKDRFLDQLYKVEHADKTDFDYVVYESDVERKFAEMLDSRDDVKLFMKLPARFKIPTPVGDYNPDWAIIKQEDGEDRIYMIRETKSADDDNKLRPSELAKIKAGRKHFAAIGISDYDRSTPKNWNL